MHRVRALVEVLICSGFPTQLFLLGTLTAAGMARSGEGHNLSLAFVSILSLADAILVIGLVLLFLRVNGERARDLLLGARPPLREAALGLLLVPVSYFLAVSVIVVLSLAAPWLHNVAKNPFEAMLRTPAHQLVFALVVTLAGGLREEIQRAFILRRFEQSLGGAAFGLILWSVAFGIGHLEQGRDVAMATAALGLFWGGIYLQRRTIISPGVAHAGFNLGEILRHAIMT